VSHAIAEIANLDREVDQRRALEHVEVRNRFWRVLGRTLEDLRAIAA
jgi:hypothetical protein